MTIYALSTAQGQAGVAIVRVSGDLAEKTINTLT
jgi:tRNA U34 5-carboxymethylaminomethyl modifying GTPase MnmE/TrmE